MGDNRLENTPVRKLIILEGADGIGKTTLAERLCTKLNASYIKQPTDKGVVGYIREEVKNNPEHDMFPRQLLHTISHTADLLYIVDKGHRNHLVMDRSFISGYIYGSLTGLTPNQLELNYKINQDLHKKVIYSNYDVSIVFLHSPKRFDEADLDVYESSIKWSKLNTMYRNFVFSYLNGQDKDEHIVCQGEKVYEVKSIKDENTTFNNICNILGLD